jgi:GDSL-like Lipase/Acylhydrolase
MGSPYVAIFGDSVPWGQGLLPQHKFGQLITDALNVKTPGLTCQLIAHSGATNGLDPTSDSAGIDGEVPVADPTLVKQIERFALDPADARLVLLNGGINDVDIRTILSPLTSSNDLRDMIVNYCHDQMLEILRQVTAKFPDPHTQMVLAGYYPILSPQSELFRIPQFLLMFGLSFPFFLPHGPILDKIIGLSMQFWKQSTEQLSLAVSDCNAELGTARVIFVAPPFQEKNAVFASEPWLFGLSGDFSPQDEVIDPRHAACDLNIDEFDIFSREQCYRASAGHPNITGARVYADAVLKAIGA